MRVAQVIGRATVSIIDPSLKGGRWLLCNPIDKEDFNTACTKAPPISSQSTLVAYDKLGAGVGDIVGVVEGSEVTAPFEGWVPLDAITVAIFDSLHFQPVS